MAGSGRWVRIQSGQLSFGLNSDTKATVYASMVPTPDSNSYHGITIDTQEINLVNVDTLSISNIEGYTGIIPMCTYFYSPYNCMFWDPSEFDINNVRTSFVNHEFVNGILVS